MCTPTPSLLKHGGVGKDSMCKWFNWLAPVRQLSIETSDCKVMKFIINISDQIGSDDRYLISSNVPIFPISDTRHLDWSFTNYHSHKVRKSIWIRIIILKLYKNNHKRSRSELFFEIHDYTVRHFHKSPQVYHILVICSSVSVFKVEYILVEVLAVLLQYASICLNLSRYI